MEDNNINREYKRICKAMNKELKNNPEYIHQSATWDAYKQLEIIRQKLLFKGYDEATGFNKGGMYKATRELLDSIYPCDAFGGQCSMYCRKYGECNGFN